MGSVRAPPLYQFTICKILELTCDAPTVHFGELGWSDVLTLDHRPTEEKLTCSGTFATSDVRIAGTTGILWVSDGGGGCGA